MQARDIERSCIDLYCDLYCPEMTDPIWTDLTDLYRICTEICIVVCTVVCAVACADLKWLYRSVP